MTGPRSGTSCCTVVVPLVVQQWYLLLYGSITQGPLTDWSRVLTAGLCEGGHCNLRQWTQATLSCVRSALDRSL